MKEYDFDIIEITKAGWQWIDGVKAQFVIGIFIYIAVAIVTQSILGFIIATITTDSANELNQQIIAILSYPVLMPLIAGMMMMALQHTRGESITFKSMFNYYHLTAKLALAGILIYIMTIIGLLLFILPGIYLSVAYVFTVILIVDKDMDVWEAMEYSRKAVGQRWFKVGGVMSLLGLIMFFGILALGIGMIWAVPLMFVTLYGLLYPLIFDEA
jgi:uncharacterized membrane protein